MPPGHKVPAGLEPDWGMEIDCPDIRTVLLQTPAATPLSFIKGWVVIKVPPTPVKGAKLLDVVAAYTAHDFGFDVAGLLGPEGFSLEVVSVTPKTVF